MFREHALACFIHDPTALKLHDDIGVDIIAFDAPVTGGRDVALAGAPTPRLPKEKP
ncbi:MAG TPA: hypothetical protein VFI47_24325 [Acidimicrobiales bacterium]|nr:hypothetical protein [Acidimicrobiales bacterium]